MGASSRRGSSPTAVRVNRLSCGRAREGEAPRGESATSPRHGEAQRKWVETARIDGERNPAGLRTKYLRLERMVQVSKNAKPLTLVTTVRSRSISISTNRFSIFSFADSEAIEHWRAPVRRWWRLCLSFSPRVDNAPSSSRSPKFQKRCRC